MRVDAMVLGAGMVGVSAALHLQARGRTVVLVDRLGDAGRETSFGNAGLIERASIFPYVFPREPITILRTILAQAPEARIDWTALPTVLPWIARYWWQSTPERAAATARAALPLIERCVIEHDALAGAAGAEHLFVREGWIKAFRTQESLAHGIADAQRILPHGLTFDALDQAALREREPHLTGFAGAVHYRDPVSCRDPGGLAQAYAALFMERGGQFVSGDARTLSASGDEWSVQIGNGALIARDVVVALGPWSDLVFAPLGYAIPLGVKRGYHMHYAPQGNAVLGHPVLDADGGYLLAPMNAGIRLTTGAEFARRDAPPSPIQLERVEPVARTTFPLAERRDAKPWMGARPCLPDLLPVIGPAPHHKGLWFDFGHQHHGFTLGPVTGRLMAELVTGETPFTDPTPYRADRF